MTLSQWWMAFLRMTPKVSSDLFLSPCPPTCTSTQTNVHLILKTKASQAMVTHPFNPVVWEACRLISEFEASLLKHSEIQDSPIRLKKKKI